MKLDAKNEFKAHFGVFGIIADLLRRRKKFRDLFNTSPMDITFLALVIAVLTIGIIMMFSASYINAWYDSSPTVNNDPYYYIKNQAKFAVIGIVMMMILSFVKTDIYRKSSATIAVIALILLVYVLINPYVIPGKEEFKRWMWVPGIGSFQPSEIAKLAVIMIISFSMERYHKIVEEKWWIFIPYGAVVLLYCVLVYAENHVSGTLLILAIGVVTIYFGGVRIHKAVYIIGGVAIVLLIAAAALNADKLLEGYASQRVAVWLKLLTGEELTLAERQDSGWQSLQSLYAIGSGGLFGLGFGNSKQKHMYLPEPQNDFVFSVVCEELGFIRSFLIIVLFVLLVARGFVIGLRAKTRFEAMLAMGISFQVGLQAALNMAVVTATIPNTGISLPFFSYGGTSLIMLLMEMGIILAISRNGERKKKDA